MDGGEHLLVPAIQDMAANGAERRLSRQRLERGSAERDDHPGADQIDLLVQPPAVVLDVAGIGRLMQAPFSARCELEELEGIGDENPAAVDDTILKASIKESIENETGREREVQ